MANNQAVIYDEIFWINEPSILFRQNNWYKILPTTNMTTNAILNALTRLFIFIAILFIIFSKNMQYICIFIIVILLIIVIYFLTNTKNTQENYDNNNKQEKNISNKENIIFPKNNPFGNFTMADIIVNPIYKQRQFYKMPSTKIMNDQSGFAKWLYQLPKKTCKEDSASCSTYEDIRYNKYNPELS